MGFCVALAGAVSAQAATVTQYTNDEAGWLSAVGTAGLGIEIDTFDSATAGASVGSYTSSVIAGYVSNYSGLSFVDDGSGDISVQDRVSSFMDMPVFYEGGEGTLQTLITFQEDVFGFGADFQTTAGTAGLGVAILMNSTKIVDIVSPTASEEFWGLVSDESFDRVLLIAGYNPLMTRGLSTKSGTSSPPRSEFLLDNVTVAVTSQAAPPSAPTPGAFAAGLALLGLVGLKRR